MRGAGLGGAAGGSESRWPQEKGKAQGGQSAPPRKLLSLEGGAPHLPGEMFQAIGHSILSTALSNVATHCCANNEGHWGFDML